MEQVNRLFSLDALTFIPIVAILFHLFLIKEKEWKCIIVFHVAGLLNFLLEIAMFFTGTRIVESQDHFIVVLTLFSLSWVDIGFFSALAYININYVFKNTDINKNILLILNLLFFIGMPLASINWGLNNVTILTRRFVASPVMQLTMQLMSIILVSLILFFTGYRRLLSYLLLIGMILGISFQSRLYLAGIRQASQMSLETLIIDTITLATMPIVAGALFCILFKQVNFIKFGDKPPLPRRVMNLRITLAAARVLIDQVGLKLTLSLLKDLNQQKKQGEPWKNLPPPECDKDKDSRALIGDAILIFRALLKRKKREEAEKIIKQTIYKSAIMQLYSLVPIIKTDDLLLRSKEERETILTQIIEKFPNTDYELIKSTDNSFAYRILRCRLVELVNDVGHPELSDAFCKGDIKYFEQFQQDINFSRPKNIGKGDSYCDFIFGLKEGD